MGDDEPSVDWEGVIRETITRATETAPTEPGVYRMPCGECVVDFFITAEGEERWLVAGDERSYTRETVAIARHGDHPWERLLLSQSGTGSRPQQMAELPSACHLPAEYVISAWNLHLL